MGAELPQCKLINSTIEVSLVMKYHRFLSVTLFILTIRFPKEEEGSYFMTLKFMEPYGFKIYRSQISLHNHMQYGGAKEGRR